ncbi:hemerythrin domain-containing protein [Paucibacter sp. Y2R2-4]|uniref:hemerythrin domain-containing protein n=1 Tax=Paucibacter sp. Y2R2-4 TaxID=2893553 RepID=UPI0021E36B35|nr:hemerythrin domain-containing protein [Paucibacter sp. Y2R2-4]MCV2352322.1 hemerythrin domain-containing protein [Paucibacter sp. Y2R2-4]
MASSIPIPRGTGKKPEAGVPHGLQPGSSYEAPFELLAACHDRLRASLNLLDRLAQHLQAQGADAAAAHAAQDLLRYFDVAAPLHHQDEELHVFPALERQGEAQLLSLCQSLRQQHEEMREQWLQLRLQLLVLQSAQALPPTNPDWAAFSAAAQRFIELQQAHLESEDGLIFPAASRALEPQQQAEIGREMAARRGLQLP